MRIEFDNVPDVEDFALVPPGRYLCRIADVRSGTTQAGAPYWSVRLEVVDGDEAGRTAGWDNLVFSNRALPRTRYVLNALGFETTGSVEIEPEQLLGRLVLAEFVEEEREDPILGRTLRLRVPWAGYEAAPTHRVAELDVDDDDVAAAG